MRATRLPEWLNKTPESEDQLPHAAKDEDQDQPPLQPMRIPTFEELAEVLPNLKKDLR